MGVTPDGWVEHAIRVSNPRSGGSSWAPDGYPYPWRIVLHEIQGEDRLEMIKGHASPPHLWYDPKDRTLYQTVPFSRGSFAMWQPDSSPYYTNRARALQVELAGASEDTPWEPIEWLTNIALDVIVPCCQWASMQGQPINLANVPPPHVVAGSAFADAPQRFSWDYWARFDGMCGHVHIPGNGDRWDPGALDMQRIAHHAALVIAGLLLPTQLLEDDVARLIVTPDRTVWSTDGVVATPLSSPGYAMTRKLGLVPPQPEWGQECSWEEVAHLLTYDSRTDSMRPIHVQRNPNAGVRPGGQAAVVNPADVWGYLKGKL